MKKFKWLIIGAVVLALLIGAYFLVSELTKEETPVEEEVEEIVIVDETNDEITTIAYKNSYGEVNFSNLAGWSYPSDTAMPVSQTFVDEMASKLMKVTAVREITGQGDESGYGFDEPTLELTVGTRGGNVHSFVVGALNDISGNYYLKYNDKIYMIDSTIVEATNYELFAALDTHTLPEINAEDILSVTVNGEEGNKEGYSSVSIGVAENYKNKEEYGFDGSENTVTVKYTVSSDITDDAGNVTSSVNTETEYTFSYATVDGSQYAMLQDDSIIYRVTGVEALEATEDTSEATDTSEAADTSDATDTAEAQ